MRPDVFEAVDEVVERFFELSLDLVFGESRAESPQVRVVV
jgi:hypothetical protein